MSKHTPNYRKRIELVGATQVTEALVAAIVLDDRALLPGTARLSGANYNRERREVYRADIYVGDERVDIGDWITVDADGHTAYWPPDIFEQVFEPLGAPEADASAPDLLEALQVVIDTIHGVENRCMAADGPVTLTSDEITETDLKRIYDAALSAIAKASA